MGFPEIVRRLTAERCENCGERVSGAYHAYECERFLTPAENAPAQPWDVKPARAA